MITRHALRLAKAQKASTKNDIKISEAATTGKIGLSSFAMAGSLMGGHLGVLCGLFVASICLEDPHLPGPRFNDCIKAIPTVGALGAGIGAGMGMYLYAFKVAPVPTAGLTLGVVAGEVLKSKLKN